MKASKVGALNPGLYRLTFTAAGGGGSSLVVVGRHHNGDRWFCAANWSCKNKGDASSLVSNSWEQVETAELIRDDALDAQIKVANTLVFKQALEPRVAETIRDLLLAGADIDAIAFLAQELAMSQFNADELVERVTSQVSTQQRKSLEALRRARGVARNNR